jgi:ACT domain
MTEARRSLVVRVWLPDRPGALGAVASRIGGVGGDVHEIEVIDHGAGRAVDEFLITVPDAVSDDLLAREIGAVDDVDVEDVRAIDYAERDPRLGSLEAAVALAEAPDATARAKALAAHAHSELRAEWVAVVDGDALVACEGEAPEPAWLAAFATGAAAGPDGVASDQDGEVAWAVVTEDRVLLAGRSRVPFRPRERKVLTLLARLAGAAA